MISRGVIVWLGIAIVTGICLFLVKYQVRQLEEKLLALNERVVANQDATHILKAEWAHLNDIARIEELSGKFLKLQPMTTAQLGSIDAIPMRRDPPQLPVAAMVSGAAPTSATPTSAATTANIPSSANPAPTAPARFDSIDQLLQHGGAQ
jgi:hypothetical protein